MRSLHQHVRLFSLGLVLGLFAIPRHAAQPPAVDPPPAQLEPKALEILKAMSARLASTQGMSFKAGMGVSTDLANSSHACRIDSRFLRIKLESRMRHLELIPQCISLVVFSCVRDGGCPIPSSLGSRAVSGSAYGRRGARAGLAVLGRRPNGRRQALSGIEKAKPRRFAIAGASIFPHIP